MTEKERKDRTKGIADALDGFCQKLPGTLNTTCTAASGIILKVIVAPVKNSMATLGVPVGKKSNIKNPKSKIEIHE